MKHEHYGAGFGTFFVHSLYDRYLAKIGELELVEPFEVDEEEVLKVLKKCLENGKDFYTNAPGNIKREMEAYDKLIEEDVLF